MSKGKTVLVGLFVLVVAVVLWANGRSTAPADPDDRPPRLTVTDAPIVTPSVTMDIPAPEVDTARAAVAAWQQQDPNVRNSQLQPLVTPDYFQLISYADPTSIPTSPVADAESVGAEDGQAAVNVALKDGTALVVTLVDPEVDGTWLVSDIEPGAA